MKTSLLILTTFLTPFLCFSQNEAYVPANPVDGTCYSRYYRTKISDGTPLNPSNQTPVYFVEAVTKSIFSEGWGGSQSTEPISIEFELYAKENSPTTRCGFAVRAGSYDGKPFSGSTNVDLEYIGLGQKIYNFDPDGCSKMGGKCANNDYGSVYRIGCNKFKIIPSSS
ncbi:MAG: hypothetical protein QE271_00795 [Bacteriovoracaceae bacterium]|nr:hypothetical protein [Bacteriovoracaceae bacterium]